MCTHQEGKGVMEFKTDRSMRRIASGQFTAKVFLERFEKIRLSPSLPRHLVAKEAHRPACLVARRISQQHEDAHCRVPPSVPCRATPPTIVRLEREQPRADAFGRAPRCARPRPARAGPRVKSRITCRIDGCESSSRSITVSSPPRRHRPHVRDLRSC